MSAKLYANGIKFALAEILDQVAFDKLYALADEIGDDETKQKSFIGDPSAYAFQTVGFETPEGFHMHLVDEKNQYHPPEGYAQSQLQEFTDEDGRWSRVEIRVGKGPKCYAFCGYCKSSDSVAQ